MKSDTTKSGWQNAIPRLLGLIGRAVGRVILEASKPGLLLVVWGLAAGISRGAEEQTFPEYQLKAALLYQFAKFTTWPTNAFPSPATPITIGICGNDPPFGTFLRGMIEGKAIAGRKLLLVEKQFGDDLADCHLLFISQSEKEHVRDILNSLSGKPVLTLGDMEKFAEAGGMVRFVRVGQNMRFELNVQAVEDSRLHVSATLGAFGILVKSGPSKR